MDRILSKVSAIFHSKKILDKIKQIKAHMKTIFSLKKTIIAVMVLFSMSLVLAGMQMNYRPNAYAVMWGEQQLGVVAEEEMAQEVFKMALAHVQEQVGKIVETDNKIATNFIHAPKKQWVEAKDLAPEVSTRILEDVHNYKVEAAILMAGDQKIILPDEKTAEAVLEKIKKQYASEENIVETGFVEAVSVKPAFVYATDIVSFDDAWKKLTAMKESQKTYTVEAGDSLWLIAKKNDMSIEELLKVNPTLTEDSLLQIGEELTLLVPKPMISVQTKEQIIYKEAISKPIEYRKDNDQFKDYRKVIEEGKDGVKEVTAHIIKINGYEEKREVVEEKVLEEPKPSIVVVGTKELPPKRATGSFRRPISGGRLTSGFGPRWGSFHAGVDLAASYGTSIYASDGGTVIFSGWNSSYGKTVKIDHGNGFVTWYAHCSSLYVSKGQKVAKGDKIAAIGSTGYSTGPHVHFEVRKNGRAQNPMNYIR